MLAKPLLNFGGKPNDSMRDCWLKRWMPETLTKLLFCCRGARLGNRLPCWDLPGSVSRRWRIRWELVVWQPARSGKRTAKGVTQQPLDRYTYYLAVQCWSTIQGCESCNCRRAKKELQTCSKTFFELQRDAGSRTVATKETPVVL